MSMTPSSSIIKLYGLERSVYTRIVRLVLEEKSVPYTLEAVEIFGAEGVPHSHLARHPFGRIPVLSHDRLSLYETSAITRYIDEAFDGPSLQPEEVTRRARMNQIISVLDAYAYRPMVWGVFVQRVRIPLQGGVTNEAEVTQSLIEAAKCLRVLDALHGQAQYLTGNTLSLADLHALPMIRYLTLASDGLALLNQHENLRRWFNAMLLRSSVQSTRSQYELP
jgi:glutathione S-transferase